MDLFNLNYAEMEKFFFVFIRIGAMFLYAPIIGSASVPGKLKIGLILVMSFLIFPLLKGIPLPQPKGIFSFGIYMLSELSIGLIIAYMARMIFISVQIAGTLVDFQMGFGVVNVIDPQTETQVSVTAQLQNILAILIFLAIDAHHYIIQAIVESFFVINPFEINFASITPEYVLHLFTATFTIAVKIAAPIMAILFFLSVGLGLVARTVPQMNVFIVGFPLQIGVGLLMVGLSISFFTILVENEMHAMPVKFMGFMRGL